MVQAMKQEIARLRELLSQHISNERAHSEEAEMSRAAAQSCHGAIETLDRLLADNEDKDD